jgi:3D (Asp-Asp-Asp) domain-containing protein
MYVPKSRQRRSFRLQLLRESVIAMLGLSIVGAASFGFGGSTRLDPKSEELDRSTVSAPVDLARSGGQGAAEVASRGHDYFDGRPIRPVGKIRMRVSAYSPDERSCGKFADGITASGFSVRTNAGHLVAADTDLLPFGSLLSIPGYACDEVVPVLDSGSAIKGARLDVLYPEHGRAIVWGVRTLDVLVWDYSDGEPVSVIETRP